jgi:hypothetical protein
VVDQSMRRSMGWAWGTGGHHASTNSDAALTYGTREIWNFICRTNYSINDMGRFGVADLSQMLLCLRRRCSRDS